MFRSLFCGEPFYNVRDTRARYAFAMKMLIEAGETHSSSEEILHKVFNQPRNLYNILWDGVFDVYFPRLEGLQGRLVSLYEKKTIIQAQLQFLPAIENPLE